METKLSSLNLDIDRVLVQLIIPGLTATFPWTIILLDNFPNEKIFLLKNLPVLITIITILSLISGLFLENIGSTIEVKHFDKKNNENKKEFPEYEEIWYKFLMLDYDGKTPTGHRYVRNILLRMKFELSFGVALTPMTIGVIYLDFEKSFITNCFWKVIIYLVPLVCSWRLIFKEAFASSKVLARVRMRLVSKFYKD